MEIESCRDCANFEDRRDMENVAICAMHHGPSVCCPEFKPRNRKKDIHKLYDRFCLKCANFESVDGIAICAKHHRPGIACNAFRIKNPTSKSRKFNQMPMSKTIWCDRSYPLNVTYLYNLKASHMCSFFGKTLYICRYNRNFYIIMIDNTAFHWTCGCIKWTLNQSETAWENGLRFS